jgi:hypothetical protein
MINRISLPALSETAGRLTSLVAALLINGSFAAVFLYSGQSDMYKIPVAPSLHCTAQSV